MGALRRRGRMAVTAKIGRIRFDEAASDVLTDYRTNGKRSLDDVERRIEKHLRPYFGNRRMASITTADIRQYIDTRQKATTVARRAYTFTGRDGTIRHVPEERRRIDSVSNGEINRELTALKRMFSLAIQEGSPSSWRCGHGCLNRSGPPRLSRTSPGGVSTVRFCRSNGDRWTSAPARSGSIRARRRMERAVRFR